MSVAFNHDPRCYGQRATVGVIRNPPEVSCTAALIERKFVASSGPPPPVDAQRLARTLTSQAESPRKFDLCVYRDRLLFHSLSRGPGLSDIPYDDIIQIEKVFGREKLLFILCGRYGIGTYYFFKLSDEFVGDKLIAIANRSYPNLNKPRQMTDTLRSIPKRRYGGWYSPNENIYESSNPFASDKFGREHSAPPSISSSASVDEIYTRPARNLYRQNSYIRWEGYGSNRNRCQVRQSTRISAPKRFASTRVLQSPYRSRSPSPRRSFDDQMLFIKAKGRGSMRRPYHSKSGRSPLFIQENNRSHSKPMAKPAYAYKKKRKSPQNKKQSRPRKKSPPVKPKTFILQPYRQSNPSHNYTIHRNYDDSVDSELSTDEAQGKKNYFPTVAKVETVRYGDQRGNNDWQNTDGWDFFDGNASNHSRTSNYRNPGFELSMDEAYVSDNASNSSEDSLYMERVQGKRGFLPNRQTNYLPHIKSKFHHTSRK